ncbi:hypothetical protein N7535_004883 [Penicillium sp. DV-2018c]|nr:hypothetical protein N7535_004883 [Penicillium sp. DV-2018c]
MFNFNFFKSTPTESATEEAKWNANTVTMQQPTSPAAPSSNKDIITEQPAGQEQMQLRGGGGGGICCGMYVYLPVADISKHLRWSRLLRVLRDLLLDDRVRSGLIADMHRGHRRHAGAWRDLNV